MSRPSWVDEIAAALPRVSADQLSRFGSPPTDTARSSAVLLLFAEGTTGIDVVLIERAADLSAHPGQISFPGGGTEPHDADRVATALRESSEEIGLDAATVEVLGTLPELWLPVSANAVTPVVGWWREPHPVYAADPLEVAAVARVSVAELVDPQRRVSVRHQSGFVGPGFLVNDWVVWGFTGGVLDHLLVEFGYAVEWDRSRLHHL